MSRWWGLVCLLGLGVCLCRMVLCAGDALALPAARQYELVSPLYKGGYGAQAISGVSSNGERVAFFSLGAFKKIPAGPEGSPEVSSGGSADYMAQRDVSEWSTIPLVPPATLTPSDIFRDLSPTLETSLAYGQPGPNYGWTSAETTENEFLLHDISTPDTEANWEVAGRFSSVTEEKSLVRYLGASPDFCQIFFLSSAPLSSLAVESVKEQPYDLSSGCDGGESSLSLVDLDNRGRLIDPVCPVELGSGIAYNIGESKGSQFNKVADDGGEVFFDAGIAKQAASCEEQHQLFVRLGGLRTVEVSRVLGLGSFGGCVSEEGGVQGEVPCAGARARAAANFVGANEEGSVVFFTSGSPAVLYMARIGCPGEAVGCAVAEREVLSVSPVSVGVGGSEAAGVLGVVKVAPDGARVYYVATGVLSGGTDSEGQSPVGGADNLYVYDSETGVTGFVADLCSGPGLSGGVGDSRCPSGLSVGETPGAVNDSYLWSKYGDFESEAQTAGVDGRFLVFSSYGRLSVDDTDTAKDVYRYDAGTGELERVSVGEEGADRNGNDDGFNAIIAFGHSGGDVFEQYEMNNRAVTEDGSRIVFSTAAPLSERDSNGLVNVYEWRKEPGWSKGRVSMVSCGCSTEPDKQAVISTSGQDVFFTSAADLVPQDTEGFVNVYDLHECSEGASCFTAPPGEAEPCEGEGCYGPLVNPAPLLVPGSTLQTPGENLALQSTSKMTTKTQKTMTKKKRDRKDAGKPKRKGRKYRGKASPKANKPANRGTV